MSDRMQPPARMRYSLASCCRAVQAVLSGVRVGVVAERQGISRTQLYRWRRRYQVEG